MPGKRIRIEITTAQWARLQPVVFSQLKLSEVQRRRVARTLIPLPSNGAAVDIFYDGRFVGAL